MKQKTVRPLVWSLVTTLIGMIALVWFGLWYINYVDTEAKARTEAALQETDRKFLEAIRESNRKWCDVVILFDDTYKNTPPTTAAGQQLAKWFNARRTDFDCEGK